MLPRWWFKYHTMRKTLLCIVVGLFSLQPVTGQISRKLDEVVEAYYSMQEFNGNVLVAKQGKVLLSKSYGYADLQGKRANTVNTFFSTASITKTFTSAMILKLAEQKKLSLDDRLSKYYPGYNAASGITIAQLLSHTAGIDDRAIQEKGKKYSTDSFTREQILLQELSDTPLASTPGATFSYSNRGYLLLGHIISKVTGLSYEQAIRAYIFKPFKMAGGFDFAGLPLDARAKGYYAETGKDYTRETPLKDSAETYAAGSIYATTGDLYAWHKVLQGSAFISKKSLEKAYTPVQGSYGYGWSINSQYGKRVVSHSGGFWGFRSNFARIPEDDVCIILLSNNEVPGLDMITKSLLAVLYDRPYTLPVKKTAVAIDQKLLQRYIGVYEIAEPHLVLEIKLENGGLVVYPKDGPRAEILALDKTHFFDKEQEGIELVFSTDDDRETVTINMNGSSRIAVKQKP